MVLNSYKRRLICKKAFCSLLKRFGRDKKDCPCQVSFLACVSFIKYGML